LQGWATTHGRQRVAPHNPLAEAGVRRYAFRHDQRVDDRELVVARLTAAQLARVRGKVWWPHLDVRGGLFLCIVPGSPAAENG
jgi:hypothetical protein